MNNPWNEAAIADFCSAATLGDVEKLKLLLPSVNVNDTDTQGSSALLYSACFGRLEACRFLLESGADVNQADPKGWTCLVWATNNHHTEIVKLLLEFGANRNIQTVQGTSLHSLCKQDKQVMGLLKEDGFYSAAVDFDENVLGASLEVRYTKAMTTLGLPQVDFYIKEEGEEEENDILKFNWNECNANDMLVFDVDQIESLLNSIINDTKPSLGKRPDAAHLVFLGSRYAHYYDSQELLRKWFMRAMEHMRNVVYEHRHDINMLAFWLSNFSLLLVFLRKDGGLKEVAEFQGHVAELIQNSFEWITLDACRRIEDLLDPSILNHNSMGFESVSFERRTLMSYFSSPSLSKSSPFKPRSLKTEMLRHVSPQSLTTVLSSFLFVLQAYDIHHDLLNCVFSQLLYFIGCEVFNQVLARREFCCRAKAMEIKMNVTILEEWIRASGLTDSKSILNHLQSLHALLQLLQVVTGFTDLPTFIEIQKASAMLDHLNWNQILQVVNQYRYEKDEPKIAEEVKVYIRMCAEKVLHMMEGEEIDQVKRKISVLSMDGQVESTLYKNSDAILAFRLPHMELESKQIPSLTPELLEELDQMNKEF